MKIIDLDLTLPVGPALPPPPPLGEEFFDWWLERLGDFYSSEYYEAWYQRTSEEMRRAEPFVM